VQNLFARMLARAAEVPGVESVSMTSVLPLSGMQINFNFQIAGRLPSRTPGEDPVASFRSVGPTYFETMGMRVEEGRGLGEADREGAPMVAVVNRALVKRYWSGVSPVGSSIGINGDQAEIVGIVADVHHTGPANPPEGEVYATFNQLAPRGGFLVLRTAGDPAAVASSLRAAIREIDPNLPLATVRPMASLVSNSTAQPRFLATLLLGFAAVAATLAVMGVYGLVSFSVGQRTREIGVRMALGASRGSVTTMVLGQSLTLVTGGVAFGALGAVALSRVMRSMLFGVEPHDPFTLVTMAMLMLVAALVASYLPAHRAARVDPVTALREE
jgi:predicted permease